ncbi:cell division protein FtsZ [Phenylobacterium montanum]|uniref:Cell division protein FtsZ n=1 Tax=Phenylobacterium montanum TaxID=2823693 RepID=A0A975G1V2_9CAUL|nr:cell division protein FtsZ [Caulobacter sp. S6]QUD89239.1 cell division protein FtsZ [Caulobacter sp. S6]
MAIHLSAPRQTELKPRIVVFGVGGAGGNAVNNMIEAGLEGVEFVVANTDAQQLQFAKTERRIQLGVTVTQGLGAGAHPEIGMSAAEESGSEIGEHLDGAHMVFITAGMGGGTGTGAAPIIAKCARERGILTVGVVTKPFTFEGRHRMRLADAGIAELQRYVDTLIVIPNQNLFRVANERTTFAEAFGMADQVLHSGVRSITDLMVLPGLINLDFADVRTVMTEMGKAMMGTGEAGGEDRALMAAQNAIANPLLDEVSLKGAKAVLVNVTGGLDMTLLEVDEAANAISDQVDPEANIIFGAAFDPALEGKIRVSVVATGMDGSSISAIEPKGRTTVSTAPLNSREPAPAPARQQTYVQSAQPAPRTLTPSPQPASYGDPRRGAYDAAPAVQPAPVAQAAPEPEIQAPSYAQVDLYEDQAPAAAAPAEPERPATRSEPERPAAREVEDAPLFPDRPIGGEERHHSKGGWLSLFGGRRQAEPPPPLRDYRNDPSPVLQARTQAQAQPVQPPLEDEHLDNGDELEIPSFLRRLAN